VQRAIAEASALVGAREIVSKGVRYGDDCAALVRAALAAAGTELAPGQRDVGGLHALARVRGVLRRGKPAPGDLVFLADRPGGRAEHVGLVQSVGKDGTALVVHRADAGVVRLRVNGAKPWTLKGADGRALNDAVVVGAGRIPAGRLLVGYASVL
jgi:cell wall-associated NlpC family hydrolase